MQTPKQHFSPFFLSPYRFGRLQRILALHGPYPEWYAVKSKLDGFALMLNIYNNKAKQFNGAFTMTETDTEIKTNTDKMGTILIGVGVSLSAIWTVSQHID